MKKLYLASCLCFFLTGILHAQKPQQREKKVVFVIADGIPADVIEKLSTPHIDSIAAKGRYVRMHVGGDKDTYNQTPTISAVGYNSLLTGVWVNKHNVPDNDITAPNYSYYNIFRLFKTQFPQKLTAIYSSWQDNRTKLAGDGLPTAGNVKIDLYADGYELDTVKFPHDRKRDFMHAIDEKVIDEAVAGIRSKAPSLSWVYLEYTDDMGHGYGDSPEFYNAVEMMDKQMGRLWAAVRYREQHFAEDWLIVITTDHGRDEQTGKHHGGQSMRQRSTWMVINYKPLNDYVRYYEPAIVDIMPTIARFLNMEIPAHTLREVDGIPMIGKVAIANVSLNYIQGNLDIKWNEFDGPADQEKKKQVVKIWVTTTNHFKTGGTDEYRLLAEVPLKDKHALVNVKELPSSFYKVVLETEGNTVNRWLSL